MTEPAPFDADTKLLKIAANDRHPQQLQALKLLRERNSCETCAARDRVGDNVATLLRYANDEQRARLAAILATHQAWKDDVRANQPQPMDNRS